MRDFTLVLRPNTLFQDNGTREPENLKITVIQFYYACTQDTDRYPQRHICIRQILRTGDSGSLAPPKLPAAATEMAIETLFISFPLRWSIPPLFAITSQERSDPSETTWNKILEELQRRRKETNELRQEAIEVYGRQKYLEQQRKKKRVCFVCMCACQNVTRARMRQLQHVLAF